jgi:hypothetical protein
MKIIAQYILHYGKEWLFHSMRSVRPFVDEIRVFYTPQPSHGHSSHIPCPESRGELYAIAEQFDAIWDEGIYQHEGQHRDHAYDECVDAGADIILVVDADEVWLPEQLKWVLERVHTESPRNWCVNMLHFWRSLGWVCRDNMWPERILMPKRLPVVENGYIPSEYCQPLHMGYAQSPGIIRYKISIHGHKNEFRPWWFSKKFMAWEPGMKDVHPTCENTWTPEPFDKSLIEDVVGDHPYFQLEVIE